MIVNKLTPDWLIRAKADLAAEPIALRALEPADGAETMIAIDAERVVGALSYRHTLEGTKIANLAVTTKRKGIGRALVESVKGLTGDRLWLKAAKGTEPFYEALGMKAYGPTEGDRTIYRT